MGCPPGGWPTFHFPLVRTALVVSLFRPAGLRFPLGLLCTASYIIITMTNTLAIPMTEEDKESKVGVTRSVRQIRISRCAMSPYGWQALYKAVCLEADFRKMPHCIALAEKAIKQRLFDGPALRIDTAELRAMHSALDALEILKAESTAQGSWSILKDV
jgi:hypothetical protein